jgi:mannose-6-phosphate isomerase-like protein (cupin superfamily)
MAAIEEDGGAPDHVVPCSYTTSPGHGHELYGLLGGVSEEKREEPRVSTGPEVSYDQGRIRAAQAEPEQGEGFNQETTVLTSRDRQAIKMMNVLTAEGLAPGFQGELIPIIFGAGIELDVLARVGVTTGPHSHHTHGFHQILNGTVRVSVDPGVRPPDQAPEVDLGPGDWVWIPADVEYTLEIVANPATIRYKHM